MKSEDKIAIIVLILLSLFVGSTFCESRHKVVKK